MFDEFLTSYINGEANAPDVNLNTLVDTYIFVEKINSCGNNMETLGRKYELCDTESYLNLRFTFFLNKKKSLKNNQGH